MVAGCGHFPAWVARVGRAREQAPSAFPARTPPVCAGVWSSNLHHGSSVSAVGLPTSEVVDEEEGGQGELLLLGDAWLVTLPHEEPRPW